MSVIGVDEKLCYPKPRASLKAIAVKQRACEVVAEMNFESLSVESDEKVLQLISGKSGSWRRDASQKLNAYTLTPRLEAKLRSMAEADEIAEVRRAAKRTLLAVWSRRSAGNLKTAAEGIKRYLSSNGISSFYHLTAKANYDSIEANGGLLSRSKLGQLGSTVTYIADRVRDEPLGTDNWVHLCFHPNSPMFYRKVPKKLRDHFLVLDVTTDVTTWDSTLFCDENATASYSGFGPDFSDLEKLKLECFKHGMFTAETKAAWQAEVLVYPIIPISLITRVRSYKDVLEEHQASVPFGAKLSYLNGSANC